MVTPTVHPHMRGAYGIPSRSVASLIGSSPHAWGLLHYARRECVLERFIPTCVGLTHRDPGRQTEHAVHPHMRGAYTLFQGGDIAASGSSPHAWGLRCRWSGYSAYRRFIPTCVGLTFGIPISVSNIAVHPHMRGAYQALCLQSHRHDGSSPHAWGLQ